jgi:hypothetical protein
MSGLSGVNHDIGRNAVERPETDWTCPQRELLAGDTMRNSSAVVVFSALTADYPGA